MEENLKIFSSLALQFDKIEKKIIDECRLQAPVDRKWREHKDKRIVECSNNFFAFCKYYFPEQRFHFKFSTKHKELIADALKKDRRCRIYAAPRDFGKTTLFRAFKCWVALFGKKHFYGKVSDTLDLAISDLKLVRIELTHNKKIVSDFGDVLDRDWNAMGSFHVIPHEYNKQGTFFEAYSTTVTSRGELRDTRLDFIEFDDFEDYSTSINLKISRQKIEIVEHDFLPSLGTDGSAIWLGNNSQTTCAVNILAQISEKERILQHPSIELKIIPAWDDKKNCPTWKERYSYRAEEEMRIALGVSKSVWEAEYQQRPSPPEGARFLRKYWVTYDSLPSDCKGIIFCDPAIGETHDYKAAAILLYSKSARRFYSPEAFCRRCGWEEYFNGLYSIYDRYKNFIAYIGWESNFFQAQFLDFQRLFSSTSNRPRLPIRNIAVQGKKEWRIEKLETPYSMGDILFSKDFAITIDGIEAQSQLISYGSGGHDDFPDALASAYNEVWNIAASVSSSEPSYIGGEKRKYKERF